MQTDNIFICRTLNLTYCYWFVNFCIITTEYMYTSNIIKNYLYHVKLNIHYVVTYIFYSALLERMLRASRAGVRDALAQHVYVVDFLQASNLNAVGFTTP